MQEKIVFQNSLLLKDFFIIDKRAYIKYNISTKGVIYMKSFEEKMNSLKHLKWLKNFPKISIINILKKIIFVGLHRECMPYKMHGLTIMQFFMKGAQKELFLMMSHYIIMD